MEVYLTRDEIVRRASARLGFTTNASQAPLIAQEMEELARAAAMEIYERFDWPTVKRELRVNVGIDQLVVDYPVDATAENILSIGVWDTNRYIPLCERFLPVEESDDPLVDEGEPASVSGRGRPQFFDKRVQIRISPRPDKVYELKIVHTVSPDLATGTTRSIVDGEAIILKVIANKRLDMGDETLAAAAEQRFQDRMTALARRASSASTVTRGDTRRERMNTRQGLSDASEINSGAWPSVMPS